MKHLTHIFSLGILIALVSSASAQAWLTNGLVAYYPFNGNANDESGNGNNGTVYGAALTTDKFGNSNSAYYFDGVSAYVSANLGTVNYYPLTFSVWFQSTDVNSETRGIVSIPAGICWCSGARLGLENGKVEGGSQGGFGPQDLFSSFCADTSWHHALVSCDSSGLNKLYLDGILVSMSQRNPTNPLATSAPLQIGRELITGGDLRNIRGRIDNVRIYNRALSSNEVAQIYAYENFCSPHRATATATLASGVFTGATMLDSGCGYTNVPSVRIIGGGGSGAGATATVTNGFVVSINVTNGGCCYTSPPTILIESPPFIPTVAIAVSKVKVTQNVRVNHNYILEASYNLQTWTATGTQFTADSESIVNEFDVDAIGRYFRLREVP